MRDGIRKLTREDGLIEQLVAEVKCSNRLAKHNNRLLNTVSWLFALAVLLLLGVGMLAWHIFGDVTVVESSMGKSVAKQNQLVEDVAELVAQWKKTDEKIDEVKQDQAEQPKVELVAEQDPEKAKDAPIKVRITPGKPGFKEDKPDPSAPTTTVEVPLPVKDVKALPQKSD